MGRVWSFIIAVIVLIVMINIAVDAIRLYLPVIGFVLLLIMLYFTVRFLIRRRNRL